MDPELIAVHPRTDQLLIGLVMLAMLGYVVVRRWPRSVGPVLVIVVALSIEVGSQLLTLLQETRAVPDVPQSAYAFLAFGTGALLFAIALPLLARRRSASRTSGITNRST